MESQPLPSTASNPCAASPVDKKSSSSEVIWRGAMAPMDWAASLSRSAGDDALAAIFAMLAWLAAMIACGLLMCLLLLFLPLTFLLDLLNGNNSWAKESVWAVFVALAIPYAIYVLPAAGRMLGSNDSRPAACGSPGYRGEPLAGDC